MTTFSATLSTPSGLRVAVAAVLALVGPFSLSAAPLTEPSTVFYGKILATGSPQPYQITEGTLLWTIQQADGTQLTLRSELFPLRGGEFSYRLNVPHSALALGLDARAGAVPLRAQDETHAHTGITVNGCVARILGPAGSSFVAAQLRRAATHRLDLEVPLPGSDVDRDGLPDWWEERFGVDDPLADPDGDGINNVGELRRGSDPNRNDCAPILATREVQVYADGTSVVLLRTIDADSAPEELRYTLVRPPELGALRLRQAAPDEGGSGGPLGANSTWTQADVNRGRLVFVHVGDTDTTTSTSFDLILQDEDPAHRVTTNRVLVHVYRPAPAVSDPERATALSQLPGRLLSLPGRPRDEQARLALYLLSRDAGFVVCDASSETTGRDVLMPSSDLSPLQYRNEYAPLQGADQRHAIYGSLAADHLNGGMEDDFIIGGPGDDTLRGCGGADVFVMLNQTDGNDTIEDFSTTDHDSIDLSRVLNGSSTRLTDYLQIDPAGGSTLLRLNFSGAGRDYTNMVVTLANVQLPTTSLEGLVDDGLLVIGDKTLAPRVSIVASLPQASENGPVAGAFTLTRTGSDQTTLVVPLQISGSAVNGLDYEMVQPQVTFARGVRSVSVEIRPYADAISEPSEAVDVAVLPSPDYTIGEPASARVTIEELVPQISIEALEPLAVKNGYSPGLFLVSRGGAVDRSVLVRLRIGGSAVNGVDYDRVNAFISLASGQTAELLQVVPRPAAALSAGPKSVQVSIEPNASYRVMAPASARVFLVQDTITLAQWRAAHFAPSPASLLTFAAEDPGGRGIANVLRYAFALDPQQPDPGQLPQPRIQDGYLTLDVRRRPEATDLNLIVEVSSDLSTWDGSEQSVQAIPPADASADGRIISYRTVRPVQQQNQLFIRARVELKP